MERVNGMTTGLMVGLAVGALVGTLMAPKSGRENREMLQEKISELSDRVMKNRPGYKVEMEGSLDTDRLP